MGLFLSYLAVIFLFSHHPYHMVMSLVMISFMSCMFVFKGFGGAWFSYIFILLFVGGLMVIFVYICTLVPNEWFYFSYGASLMLLLLLTIGICSDYKMYTFFSQLSAVYSMSVYYIFFLGCLLYFSLLMVVKMVYSPQGGMKSYF